MPVLDVSFTHRLLAVLLLPALLLAIFPISWASEELVKNGGFETADFTGWTAANSSVQPSKGSQNPKTAHSGEYSARIGTETVEGRLSQSVSIPAKSIAKFTTWYRAEKGSKLGIFLKKSDGTTIAQWSARDNASWTSLTYDLDLSYAGQSVTIEFAGIGRQEIENETHKECDVGPQKPGFTLGGTNTRKCHMVTEVVDVHHYWPYVDDVSFTYTIVAYEATVSIVGLPHELTTRLLVDSANEARIAGAESRTFLFKIGETHSISVDAYVYKDNRTRYYCVSNFTNVGAEGSSTFRYKPQYLLSVSSQHGTATGTRWYAEGSEAFAVLDAGTVSDDLFHNWVFAGWTNDAPGTGLKSDPIVMDGPKDATAKWNREFSMTFYTVITVVVVVPATAALMLIRPRKRPSSEVSPGYVEFLAKLENLRVRGEISEEIYQKLKDEYWRKFERKS